MGNFQELSEWQHSKNPAVNIYDYKREGISQGLWIGWSDARIICQYLIEHC